MTEQERAAALWQRAIEALAGARVLLDVDTNGAASRAFYAAFDAVSALFMLEGKEFRSHKELQTAVHRDLVHPGRWDKTLGADYSLLHDWRNVGDYGDAQRVDRTKAEKGIHKAEGILEAVRAEKPNVFGATPGG